jgi:hypothetical protein
MAYVQQVCDGYNKKSLMGNWQEERLYPKQPFREEIVKAVQLTPYSQDPRTKESPVSTTLASKERCLVSNAGTSGKPPTGSSLTTDSYIFPYLETYYHHNEGIIPSF